MEFALAGHTAVMPAIVRVSDKPYRWKIGMAPLSEVANKEKMLPRGFISADGFGITAKARAYLAPLIRGEAGDAEAEVPNGRIRNTRKLLAAADDLRKFIEANREHLKKKA